jgi:polyribonucleotide nucleotidyltransferase
MKHFAEKVGEEYGEVKSEYHEAFTMALHKDVRKGIIDKQIRPDGRKLDEVRPNSAVKSLFCREHTVRVLFTRGVTQAMNIVTLAPL